MERQTINSHAVWEERANCLTHGFGLILSFIGLFILLIAPIQNGEMGKAFYLGVYGSSLILLYLASTLYHGVRHPQIKQILRTIDHCAIYLLIAGSYTPFTMLILEGIWGWALFAAIWSLAFVGILFKIYFRHRFEFLSTLLYLVMGWLVIVAVEPMVIRFHPNGLYWLLAGGLSYTGGVIFYAMDTRRFFHAIWHLFVLAGSSCHYIAVLLYI